MTQIPPYQPYPGPPGGGTDAANQVKGPAIGLLVTGGIGMALQLVALLMNLLGVGLGAAGMSQGGSQEEAMANMLSGGLGIVSGIVGIIMGVVVILGALKMMKLQSWGFALAAAIIAMVPCVSPCCCIGLPIGIWAIIVLVKPEVKAAFTA